MNRKKLLYAALALVAIVVVIYFLLPATSGESSGILVQVKKGNFVVDITTTGELEAKNSVSIMGPSGTRNYRIWNITIQEIIDEGSLVAKGDFVAQLDPTELTNNLKDAQLELEKIESQFIQTKLDTTLQMRQTRDEIVNLTYEVDEKQLILNQSQYEPPATVRQAEINLDKSVRALEQARENYKIKKEQNIAKMQEVALNRQKQQNSLDGMSELMDLFTITAPEDGMLIYKKDWNGESIKAGSQISAWDPVVATLPDLGTMLSVTYINEVDIRRVKVGQRVEIGLDAFPDKKMTGKVIRVANVGEQRPNSDAKIFMVSVEVKEKDDLLRPAMTTSNRIVTETTGNALYIPLECLFNQDDSITYVYKRSGLTTTKQEVIIGPTNRNEVVITAGLEAEDKVYLSRVSSAEDQSIVLLPEMEGKRQKKENGIAPGVPEEVSSGNDSARVTEIQQ